MAYEKTMPRDIAGNPIYRDVWNRLYQYNKNFLGVFCGQTGSSKSYAAMRYAYNMDRGEKGEFRFDIDKVVFSADEFIAQVRKKQNKGTFIVWDEVGVGVNSRLFYQQQNINISYITQTFRYLNLGVLYTVPSFNYVDKQVRQLFHAYIQMKGANIKEMRSYGKFQWIQYNPKSGKIYFKYPRYWDEDGNRKKVEEVSFEMIPKELEKAYEEKKKEKTEEWYKKYSEELNTGNDSSGGHRGETLAQKIYKKVNEEHEEYMNAKKGKVDVNKISLKLGVGRSLAYVVAKNINEEKGYE